LFIRFDMVCFVFIYVDMIRNCWVKVPIKNSFGKKYLLCLISLNNLFFQDKSTLQTLILQFHCRFQVWKTQSSRILYLVVILWSGACLLVLNTIVSCLLMLSSLLWITTGFASLGCLTAIWGDWNGYSGEQEEFDLV
jgi:hypothetical protein